jgi:hypothetical protein
MEADSRQVVRDGMGWLLGTAADVAWINEATSICVEIDSAIPPVFDAYATIVLPESGVGLGVRHDQAMIELLRRQSPEETWWLGYLDTGSADVVFPDAPRMSLYANWSYVVVQAGPEQALRWRPQDGWSRRLPDLIFPTDRSWLVSTLWDDDWTCVGGPGTLIDGVLHHPDLESRARRVSLGEDATPPGHEAL